MSESAPETTRHRDLTEVTLESQQAWRGDFLRVHQDRVRLPDGSEARREYIRHPGAAIIIPMLDDDTFVMERQYRYPMQQHFIEFPAGKLEPDEPALVTARRELLEETGYVATDWRHLATTHPCIGYSNEVIELFLARGLTHAGATLDAGEFLDVFTMSRDAILANIRSGGITDTKTILAMLWLERFGMPPA